MRALTVDGRRTPRPLTAMRSEIRTDPSPGRPTPEPRPTIARDLSARPFGGAVARGATGRLLSTRPIAPVDAILGRVPARGGAATPRAPARLRAVVIARACYYGASAKEPLFKKFTLGSQSSSCVRSVLSCHPRKVPLAGTTDAAMETRSNRRKITESTVDKIRRGEVSAFDALATELPDVFNAEILSKLPLEDALNLARVNKRYNDAVWSVDGVRAMKPIMEARRVPCESLDKLGATPMYFAARHGNVPAVRALLKSPDLDIDEEVLEGEIEPFTALQTAAAWQSPGVVKLLIDAGADVDKCNVDTGTPPLHLAAENGNTTIAMLLIKAGAEVNLAEPLHGKTPLWFAVAEHHMPIVSMLVLSGADVDIAPFDDDDMSPMEMSEDMKCEGITELLRLAPSRTDATVQSSVD